MNSPSESAENKPISSESVQLLDEYTHSISDTVTEDYLARHSELPDYVKSRVRGICREDMGHHLAFLKNALYTGIADVLLDYLKWLKQVLLSRDLDTTHTLDALKQIQQQLRQILPEQDQPVADSLLNQAISVFINSENSGLVYSLPAVTDIQSTEQFIQALTSSNQRLAESIVLKSMDGGMSLTEASVGIIQPSMCEIGRLWENNRLSVAEEHLSTAIAQNIMARAYSSAGFKDPINKTAVFSCVEKNHHSLGLRMVSNAFEVAGWEVSFLGENLPTDSLVKMLDKSSSVDLVGLSISLYQQLDTLNHVIDVLKAEFGARCPVIAVGGFPLNTLPSLAGTLKADTWFFDAQAVAKDLE